MIDRKRHPVLLTIGKRSYHFTNLALAIQTCIMRVPWQSDDVADSSIRDARNNTEYKYPYPQVNPNGQVVQNGDVLEEPWPRIDLGVLKFNPHDPANDTYYR